MYKLILKNSIKNILCAIFIFVATTIQAQDASNDPSKFLPNITPPSPEAFKFSMYGNTPVGLFTGTPNIQLPLFTYKTNNLNVPFSLNYSSSGIKVDDVNTKTGIGWNLIGGGVITRIVRNLEDNFKDDFPFKHLNISSIEKTSAMQNVYFNLYGENLGKDSERDLYLFNFLNYSGKFYFDDNNKIVFFEKNDIKIELVDSTGGDIFTFIVTTLDGTKYYFQETEQTMLRTYGAGHVDPSIKTTAWYLNKIVHPEGDEIYLNYVASNQYYVQSESQQAARSFPFMQNCASGQGYSKGITFGPIYSHTTRIVGKTIKSITSNNPISGSIDFVYEDKNPSNEEEPDDVIKTITVKDKSLNVIEKIDFDYLLTGNKRIFLNGFHFLEETNKYSFNYINPTNFPPRLSKSQDHWGYFNGANNLMLLPKINDYGFQNYNYDAANREINETNSKIGLLNKIVYPTKGFTDLEYESNDYYGAKKIMPSITYKSMILENNEQERNKENTTSFFAGFSYTAKFTGETYFANCDPSLDTGGNHHKGSVQVFCVEDNSFVGIYQYSDAYGIQVAPSVTSLVLSSNSTTPYYFNVEQNKNYIVKLVNAYNCIHSKIDIEYYTGVPQIINTNILTGGCRVKSAKNYSLYNPVPTTKRYYYSKFDQLTVSSGDILQEPYYFNFSDHQSEADNGLGCTVTDVVMNSSSVSSLFEMGSNVYYSYITVSNGDNFENGYEENEFTINKDYREIIYLGDREFRNVPWTNLGWSNGKLVNTKIFEKQSNTYFLRKTTTNNYLKKANNSTIVNFAIYNPCPGILTTTTHEVECQCNQSTINEMYPVKYCSALHFHQKDANGNCIASNAINIDYNIPHPCVGKSVGQIIGIPTINYLDIMPYNYISYFVYLSSTITTEYDRNGLNPIETAINYNYNSPAHLQLTSQNTINSKQETLETKYFYAPDIEMVNQPFRNDLVAKNIIGVPLDTQTFKGGIKLSEQTTIYDNSVSTNNLLLPKSIYAAKFPNTLPSITNPLVGQLEKKISYDLYDSKGNIQQYTLENGVSVTIIWGYNQTQPIAKIENATYGMVTSYVANLQTLSSTGTEASLLTALNNLRNASELTNAIVTTYTYKPLIGVSTVTDSKGYRMSYEYNEFNRLKLVKDAQGNILSENQYHYKN